MSFPAAAAVVAILLALAGGCTGWPSFTEPANENLKGAVVTPGRIGLLPPESPRLDSLLVALPKAPTVKIPGVEFEEKGTRDRRLVEAMLNIAPGACVETLGAEGLTAVALSRTDLLRHVVSGGISLGPPAQGAGVEDRLSYASLARTFGFTQILRIVYDGNVRKGTGSDSWLFGMVDVDYPAGTWWYEIQMTAELLDAETGEVQVRSSVAGKSHSSLFTMTAMNEDADMLQALARSVAARAAEDLVEATRTTGPPAPAPGTTSSAAGYPAALPAPAYPYSYPSAAAVPPPAPALPAAPVPPAYPYGGTVASPAVGAIPPLPASRPFPPAPSPATPPATAPGMAEPAPAGTQPPALPEPPPPDSLRWDSYPSP